MKTFNQGPQDVLDYQQSLAGDTIVTAAWRIEPDGATVGNVRTNQNSTTARVSGIKEGTRYTLFCHIVGASGQEWTKTYTIFGAQD